MDEETVVEMLFEEIDEDGSGTLDRDEIALCARKMGQPLSEDALDAAMKEMDEDGNGSVDFAEFYSWFKTLKTKGGGGGFSRIATMRADYYFACIKGDGSHREIGDELDAMEAMQDKVDERKQQTEQRRALAKAGPEARVKARRAQQRILPAAGGAVGVALRGHTWTSAETEALARPRFGRRSPGPKRATQGVGPSGPRSAGGPGTAVATRPANNWHAPTDPVRSSSQ